MSYADDFEEYDSITATPGGTPSTGSQHIGSQYWDSNFPSLLSNLGVDAKLPKIKRIPPKRKSTGSSQKSFDTDKRNSNFSNKEELGKRNEGRWLKIDNIVREKMEEFDEFFLQLVANNETKREENDRNAHLLYNKLWLAEEKKRQAVLKDSTYDRIWRHHALMRQRGEEEWRRKMAKKNQHHPYDDVAELDT
uniref:Uncharacterized protein LOC111115630 n=1 Tax=Crassostrea virginica TaxID=6565 RepID=A0A8B8C3I3_CRAVI|nr:uncharacterized protein LOC111115630 [Crassostrea virginica]